MMIKILHFTPWIILGVGLVFLIIKGITKYQLQNKSSKKPTSTTKTTVVTPANPTATTTTNTTVTTTKKTSPWTVFWNIVATAAIIFVAVMLFLIVSSITRSCDRPRTPGNSAQSSSLNKPTFTTHVTPCEWTENGEFYLESDDPIAQKFPSIPQIITYSGKGKSEVPYGRKKGPIKFWDPSDPINGRKEFRIYPVK